MSGPARTAAVTVTVELSVTDTATEGEMVDAVNAAIRAIEPERKHPGATVKACGVTTEITTAHTGGHL
jgi:hypothetical protein